MWPAFARAAQSSNCSVLDAPVWMMRGGGGGGDGVSNVKLSGERRRLVFLRASFFQEGGVATVASSAFMRMRVRSLPMRYVFPFLLPFPGLRATMTPSSPGARRVPRLARFDFVGFGLLTTSDHPLSTRACERRVSVVSFFFTPPLDLFPLLWCALRRAALPFFPIDSLFLRRHANISSFNLP
jgi:hypothetical protein